MTENPFSRRSFVRLLAVAAPAAATAMCAPTQKSGAPTATASVPSSSATAAAPTAAPAAIVGAARPAVVRSFGPNGTHWPAHTPWIGDAVTTVEVACTWAAIRTALLAVTASKAAAGVHIKVRPGTLPGLGASSGSKAVLQGLGSAQWSKNVLISPRDGWG